MPFRSLSPAKRASDIRPAIAPSAFPRTAPDSQKECGPKQPRIRRSASNLQRSSLVQWLSCLLFRECENGCRAVEASSLLDQIALMFDKILIDGREDGAGLV